MQHDAVLVAGNVSSLNRYGPEKGERERRDGNLRGRTVRIGDTSVEPQVVQSASSRFREELDPINDSIHTGDCKKKKKDDNSSTSVSAFLNNYY